MTGELRRINLADPPFEQHPDLPDGFRPGIVRIGRRLGARTTGMSVYELPPGQAICPYHYEYPTEEWAIVIEGTPTVRHPGGDEQLQRWDVVFFPTGRAGAHALRNDGDTTARVLMFSDFDPVGASVYPDSDKVAIWTGNDADDVIVERSSAVDYWHGEVAGESP